MTRTCVLAVAVLVLAGCKGPEFGLGTSGCFMDSPCSNGPGNYGPIIVTSMIGFPSSGVDTVGPLAWNGHYYGRLQVGDSVTLHLVRHEVQDDPCAAPDTLRRVTWSSFDSTVLRARPDANGRGVVRAVATGESMVVAADSVTGTTTNVWTCEGSRSRHFIGRIRVEPKSP